MRIYGAYEALEKCYIDFIEFRFKKIPSRFKSEDADDNVLTASWDTSEWSYDEETGLGSFKLSGVSLNDTYANGFAGMFRGSKMTCMQVYAPDDRHEDPKFTLTALEVCDGDTAYAFSEDALIPQDMWYEG